MNIEHTQYREVLTPLTDQNIIFKDFVVYIRDP